MTAPTNQSEILFKDFTLGWIPSDDAIAGRKNGLLKMSGCTLDENGSLTLAQGMVQVEGPYAANAHSLFIKQMCGERRVYVGLEDGSVWRNNVNLIPAGEGSVDRTAFGVYGDYVIIMSGDSRVKDSCGASLIDLGLITPDEAPLVNILTVDPDSDSAIVGTFSNFIAGTGSVSVVDSKLHVIVSNDVIVNKTVYITNFNSADFAKDLSGSDDDIFQFTLYTLTPDRILAVTLDFVMKLEDGFYQTEKYSKVLIQGVDFFASTDVTSDGTYVFKVKRSAFTRSGSDNAYSWANIIGVGIGVSGASQAAGSYYTLDVEADLFGFKLYRSADDGSLNGTYTWLQVNVYSNNGYTALSAPGPATVEYQVINGIAEVIPQDPTLIEPNANEVWIYRRGGNLRDYYRVGVILYDELGPLYDNLSDQDVLDIGIKLNTNVISVGPDDLDDTILDMVGPVAGRMVYFSASKIYFSEINNPDTYDPRNVINLTSDQAETFQFAKKVSDNTIMIGTIKDVYILVGTYTQFPDGALDVYLRSLGVNKPPMSRFCTVYNGTLIYFGSQAWVAMSPAGQYTDLVSPNTDVLYTGKTVNGIGGVPTISDNLDISYSCTLAKNQLWCIVPYIVDYDNPADDTLWLYRMEIFDFARKYWRPIPYAPFLIAINDDEALYGFFNETKTVNYMDSPFTKLLNAT